MSPTKKRRLRKIWNLLLIFLLLGVHIYVVLQIFPNGDPGANRGAATPTYRILPDGTRPPIDAPNGAQETSALRSPRVAMPSWGRNLTAAMLFVIIASLLAAVILIFRLAFSPKTFRRFRLAYGIVALASLSAAISLAVCFLIWRLRWNYHRNLALFFWTNGVFCQSLFIVLLLDILSRIREERSRRELDVMEVE